MLKLCNRLSAKIFINELRQLNSNSRSNHFKCFILQSTQSRWISESHGNQQITTQTTSSAKSASKDNDSSNKNDDDGPLKGIRILDLSRVLAAPFCTMILGDLGAEIIKVEKPGTGDDTREWGPPYIGNLSTYFVCTNRNKKSIAIDMKKGSHIIKKLVKECDVLVENYIPGSLQKYGLNYEELCTINPQLIYCSLTGYGSTGPYKNRGGYDVIVSGLGGLMHITGPRSNNNNSNTSEPCKVGVALTDLCTGLYLHGAIMAALLQRYKTNKGQKIDCNLLSTQISILANIGSNYLNNGQEATRWGSAHESIVPYQAFQTKDDKWIIIGAANDNLYMELCNAINLPDNIKSNSKFLTNPLRVQNREELINILQSTFILKSCKEWLDIFEQKKCRFPFGPVNDLKSAFNDPQVIHNGLVQKLGPYTIVGPAVQYSESINKPRSPPPILGQHTKEILTNLLNLSSEEIEKLYSDSIVQ